MKDKDNKLLEEAYDNILEEGIFDLIVDPEARKYFMDKIQAGFEKANILKMIKKWLIQKKEVSSFSEWIQKQERLEEL